MAGVGLLGFSFSVLMELLRLAFSGPWAIAAIARNVVNEAVRIKVSAVFIVLLLLALAALPGLLQESTPLRYRVQSFLQYGTAGAFWIIAILVVFLSVSTVAFEQRERVIWQTMTKPVAAWQYLLGKWLGVVGVAAVLLGVSASGVFLFTEYLRDQRAIGEWAPYRAQEGIASEDRLVLESQVLTARAVAGPELGQVVTDEIVARTVQQNLQAAKTNDPSFEIDQAGIDQMVQEVREQLRTQYLTIEPGNREVYLFTGLEGAKQLNKPISLRFRVNVGGNDPRGVFRITFLTENMAPQVMEVPFGTSMALPLSPASIREDGTLLLGVVNGDTTRGVANDDSMTFPPDGLEVYYPVGSYRLNFARVVAVLWLKLAFLAMVGVWAATFLSFPVASLVAFGVFFVAESAGFLINSLEYFATRDQQGNINYFKVLVRAVAVPVANAFGFYSGLRPTGSLVEGRLVGWGTLAKAAALLGLLTSILYAVAVVIFRRRELATYSGQ